MSPPKRKGPHGVGRSVRTGRLTGVESDHRLNTRINRAWQPLGIGGRP
jgi:hypothetical protein